MKKHFFSFQFRFFHCPKTQPISPLQHYTICVEVKFWVSLQIELYRNKNTNFSHFRCGITLHCYSAFHWFLINSIEKIQISMSTKGLGQSLLPFLCATLRSATCSAYIRGIVIRVRALNIGSTPLNQLNNWNHKEHNKHNKMSNLRSIEGTLKFYVNQTQGREERGKIVLILGKRKEEKYSDYLY